MPKWKFRQISKPVWSCVPHLLVSSVCFCLLLPLAEPLAEVAGGGNTVRGRFEDWKDIDEAGGTLMCS
eukprot:1883688-Amphidinium_carterae.1